MCSIDIYPLLLFNCTKKAQWGVIKNVTNVLDEVTFIKEWKPG